MRPVAAVFAVAVFLAAAPFVLWLPYMAINWARIALIGP
jgi:hypothetical protein